MRRYRLYMGRNSAVGRVSAVSFHAFLRHYVDPHFSGYTVFEAQGHWKGQREDSWVLEVLTEGQESALSVQRIAEDYAREFHQESVLVSAEDVAVEFITGNGAIEAEAA